MIAPPRPARGALVAAAVVAVAFRLFAAWAIPFAAGASDPNCAPDEAWHFWVAKDLAGGRAPTWPDGSWSIYAAFPPSQYAVHALTANAARIGLDVPWAYRYPPAEPAARGFPLVRLGSVLLGVATVVLLAGAALVWSDSARAAAMAGLLAAAFPQLVFVGGYTNADSYTIAAGALLVLALSRWAVRGEGAAGAALLGLATGAVLVGKPSGYFVLPPTVFWLAGALWRATMPGRAVAVLSGMTVLAAGPWLAWNAVRNHGDVLGLERYAIFLARHWRRSTPADFAHPVWTFATTLTQSAIGVAGNMDRPLSPRMIGLIATMLVIGLGWSVRLLPRLDRVERRWAAWIVAAVGINVALVAYNCWYVDFQPQGRYVLTSVVGLAIVAACAPSMRGGSPLARIWGYASVAIVVAGGLGMVAVLWRQPCAYDPVSGGRTPAVQGTLDVGAPTTYGAAP